MHIASNPYLDRLRTRPCANACRRCYFTLLELMIALAVIGSVAGIIGINANKAMRQQRFRAEVSTVVQQLRLAQNLMLVLNQDVKIHFAKDARTGAYTHKMSLQCPLESPWEKELLRTPAPLREIVDIKFSPSGKGSANKGPNDFELLFLSGGAVMSQGVIELDSRGGEKRTIFLQGAPHPIVAEDKSSSADSTWSQHMHAQQQLAMDTVQEINARKPASTGKPSDNSEPNAPGKLRRNARQAR
jgi:prepilin-type N-terminal cleavage/methylation domain-containing protein